MSAIKKGMTARYHQLGKMLRAFTAAYMEGKIERYLKNIAKVDVLIIDDFLLIEEAGIKEVRQLFEIIDERAERGGIIMASQIPVGKWHERMAEPTIADAIFDRLIHNAYRIELKGGSLRKKQQVKIPEMVKYEKEAALIK
jgi:DNA replication protein DnaC